MIYKPHLALLLPVALLAGRQWRAIAAAALTSGALLGVSWFVFGPELWAHYRRNLAALRHAVLEVDLSPQMVLVFIAARSLGASVETAYWVQGGIGALACLAVAWVWFKDTPAAVKYAVLLLGTCLAAPYLQDYDLVFGAIVVAWLWQQPVEPDAFERALQIGSGLLLLLLPLVAAALAHLTGIAFGPLFIMPLFIVALQMSAGARPAVVAASSSRLSSAQQSYPSSSIFGTAIGTPAGELRPGGPMRLIAPLRDNGRMPWPPSRGITSICAHRIRKRPRCGSSACWVRS